MGTSIISNAIDLSSLAISGAVFKVKLKSTMLSILNKKLRQSVNIKTVEHNVHLHDDSAEQCTWSLPGDHLLKMEKNGTSI